MKLDEVVEKYIKLRDKKAEFKAEYDSKVASIDAMLEKVEGVLLKQFQETGIDSVKTRAGTAYTSTRTSATIADWDSFFAGFVVPNQAWEMLEHRVSKSAVEQYRAANEDLPPGINYSETRVVNVRRG